MARAKRKSYKKRGFNIPVALIAGFAPAAGNILREAKASGWSRALQVQVPKSFLGYNPDDGSWGTQYWNQGLTGIMIGTGVHILASKLGLNRRLAAAKIPLLRI